MEFILADKASAIKDVNIKVNIDSNHRMIVKFYNRNKMPLTKKKCPSKNQRDHCWISGRNQEPIPGFVEWWK